MVKLRLINRANGLSKASGNPWCRLTLCCDHADGNRTVSDFFVNPEVASRVASIPLDSLVYVSADLDSKLHFSISDIRPVEATSK